MCSRGLLLIAHQLSRNQGDPHRFGPIVGSPASDGRRLWLLGLMLLNVPARIPGASLLLLVYSRNLEFATMVAELTIALRSLQLQPDDRRVELAFTHHPPQLGQPKCSYGASSIPEA